MLRQETIWPRIWTCWATGWRSVSLDRLNDSVLCLWNGKIGLQNWTGGKSKLDLGGKELDESNRFCCLSSCVSYLPIHTGRLAVTSLRHLWRRCDTSGCPSEVQCATRFANPFNEGWWERTLNIWTMMSSHIGRVGWQNFISNAEVCRKLLGQRIQ